MNCTVTQTRTISNSGVKYEINKNVAEVMHADEGVKQKGQIEHAQIASRGYWVGCSTNVPVVPRQGWEGWGGGGHKRNTLNNQITPYTGDSGKISNQSSSMAETKVLFYEQDALLHTLCSTILDGRVH